MNNLTIKDIIHNANRLGLPLRHIGVPWFQIYQIEEHFKKKGLKGIELEHKINEDIIRLQNEYYIQEYNLINAKIIEVKKKIRKKEKSLKNEKSIKNEKKKLEKKKKNNNDEDIDKILEEIKREEKCKNKNKTIEKMKSIKEKVNKTGIGEMDVIEENKDTLKNKNKEYLFHLREQIISIEYEKDYEKDNNFRNALISLILKDVEKINKIKIITKCDKIFFDDEQNCFRIFVKKEDKEQYKKIISATLLISNMIAKFRETLETGKIFFKRTAIMF
tara:strand:+ start:74 stop:898 length:825 start_codon:yes stop_codon:yes gene_type:complete